MAVYTVSNCLLENIGEEKRYLTEILFVFAQQSNPFKIALDKSDKVLSLYEEAAKKSDLIASWLSLMSMKPSSFEIINIEIFDAINEEELFLKICSATKVQHKLIIYSHEGWKKYTYNPPKIIVYSNVAITIFDRDEAIQELVTKSGGTINAFGSVIATDQSTITKVKNEINE